MTGDEFRQWKAEKAERAASKEASPSDRKFSFEHTATMRASDLDKLADLRSVGGKLRKGRRSVWLHYRAVCVAHLDAGRLDETMLEIGARRTEFTPSEVMEKVASVRRYVRQKKTIRPTNDAIITALGITEDEMHQAGLETVTTKDMRLEPRKKMRKARDRAAGAKPREASAAQIEPWLTLGVSRATYYRQTRADLE